MNFKTLFGWVAWIVPVTTFIILLVIYRNEISGMFSGDSKSKIVRHSIESSTDPVKIKITKTRTPEIVINHSGSSKRFRFIPGALDEHTPYIIHYNGGSDKGGWEYSVPAFKDWKKLGYAPPTGKPGGVTASFSLPEDAPMEEAWVYYKILPIP